jgi:HNH endonuclease
VAFLLEAEVSQKEKIEPIRFERRPANGGPGSALSREEIMAAIKKCAQELGRTPTFTQVAARTPMSRPKIKRLFGSYGRAVRACGLEHPCGAPVSMEVLFHEWAGLTRKLKRVPTMYEFARESSHTCKPLAERYKGWCGVPAAMLQYMEKKGTKSEWKDVAEAIRRNRARSRRWQRTTGFPRKAPRRVKALKGRPTFGPPLVQSGMLCGPENENGVLVLFGMWAWRLGFAIKKVRPGFPDIIALRKIDEQTWQEVNIEVEQESRNFVRHKHSVDGADLIVCWIHNWPECPIEVLELSKVEW